MIPRPFSLALAVILAIGSAPATGNAGGRVAIDAGSIHVYDGDTIIIERQRMRLVGVDSPEVSRPRCDRERSLAYAARDRLRELLDDAAVIELALTGEIDPYDRPLITLFADGSDVRAPMLAEGLAGEWRPGRAAWIERQRHWCGS